MPSRPCTGAQGANSPLGVHRGQGPRHRSPPGAHGAGGAWLLSIPWPVPPAMDGTPTMAGSFDDLHLATGFASALRAPAKPVASQHCCDEGRKNGQATSSPRNGRSIARGTGVTLPKPAHQCHPGLDPGPRATGTALTRLPWTPDQVRGDAPGNRRDRGQGPAMRVPSATTPFVVMPGLVPLLSGLDGSDPVQGVGRGRFPALPPVRDTDRGLPSLSPCCHPGLDPGSRATGTALARLPWTPDQVRGDNRGAETISPVGTEPVPKLNRTAMDLFRASTPCGIAVRAGRGRGGGGTWMPGTSRGMTTGGRRGGAPVAGLRQPTDRRVVYTGSPFSRSASRAS